MAADSTIADSGRALRRHYARLADLYAQRWFCAVLEGNWQVAVACERAYHAAAAHCHALGEQMRRQPSVGASARPAEPLTAAGPEPVGGHR